MADYFRLDPIGVGTNEIECFPSYLCRLAALHGVSLHQFCKHLAQWWSRPADGDPLPSGRVYDSKSALFCGIQPTLHRYVEAVEVATGAKNIARTTLLPIRPAMSPLSIGLVKRHRDWCPACMHEQIKNDRTVYSPLLWCMAPVKRCFIHQLSLLDTCPTCGSPQNHFHRNGETSLCYKCHAVLIGHPHSWRHHRTPCYGEKDCIELVEAISTGELKRAKDCAFQIFSEEIDRLFAKSMQRPMGIGLFELIHSHRELFKKNKEALSTFPLMLRHCVGTGVRLIDVLNSPREAAKSSNLLFPIDDLPVEGRRRQSLAFHRHVSSRLEKELAKPSDERVTPYSTIKRELGVSEGYLRYRFEVLSRKYRLRSSAEYVDLAEEKTICVRKFIDENIHLFPSSTYPTQRDLVESAARVCSCGVRKARIVLSVALNERRLLKRSHKKASSET